MAPSSTAGRVGRGGAATASSAARRARTATAAKRSPRREGQVCLLRHRHGFVAWDGLASKGVTAGLGVRGRGEQCSYSSLNAAPRRSGRVVCSARPDLGDRIVASVPYLLPLLDGLRYGRFFFAEFPQTAIVLAPLQPLIKTYYTLPFASLIVFFSMYYGIVNNYKFSRFIRFNAMQTILLDILLIIPSLIENFFLRGPKSGAILELYISFYNFVWLYVAACVIYGVAACLAGETPRIPGVADAADRQVPL
mmetsp:Transcript_12421/g.31530  ORF Transcript_12421/g.31530 Transcript_12421/m.31530 type:complete len:251 (-) Transcript_12421:174-926(-)